MTHPAVRRTTLGLLPGLVLAACTGAGSVSSGPPGTASAPPGAIAGVGSSVPTRSATLEGTVAPTESPARTQPPDATLAVDGGDPVTGQLGTYTWNTGGSDSPWLPGAPVAAGAGETLTMALADGVAVSDWSGRRVRAGTTEGSGSVDLGGSGGPSVSFDAPPPGSWSVQVTVQFAGGLGSAAYYWQIAVK